MNIIEHTKHANAYKTNLGLCGMGGVLLKMELTYRLTQPDNASLILDHCLRHFPNINPTFVLNAPCFFAAEDTATLTCSFHSMEWKGFLEWTILYPGVHATWAVVVLLLVQRLQRWPGRETASVQGLLYSLVCHA